MANMFCPTLGNSLSLGLLGPGIAEGMTATWYGSSSSLQGISYCHVAQQPSCDVLARCKDTASLTKSQVQLSPQ